MHIDKELAATRLDVWLWAVRLTPTRSAATELCRSAVKVGDRIEARIAQRQRIVEVVRVIGKRVGAPVAAECLVDHSPPVERDAGAPVMQRDRGSGRPTKRDRRQIDRLRGG